MIKRYLSVFAVLICSPFLNSMSWESSNRLVPQKMDEAASAISGTQTEDERKLSQGIPPGISLYPSLSLLEEDRAFPRETGKLPKENKYGVEALVGNLCPLSEEAQELLKEVKRLSPGDSHIVKILYASKDQPYEEVFCEQLYPDLRKWDSNWIKENVKVFDSVELIKLISGLKQLENLPFKDKLAKKRVLKLKLKKHANRALRRMVKNSYPRSLEIMVNKGANPNTRWLDGKSLLSLTARKGKDGAACMEVLLKNGGRVDAADEQGYMPLIWAAQYGKHECMEKLVRRGALPDAHDEEGFTPLMWAAINGHAECVKELARLGASVNLPHKGLGITPLIWAACRGHATCVEVLVQERAELEVCNNIVPLNLEIQNKRRHSISLTPAEKWQAVCEQGLIPSIMEYELRPLMWAAIKGHANCVKVLLESKALVDAQDKNGVTALMRAASENHIECIKALIQVGGADCRLENKVGKTALAIARERGHSECVDVLKAAEQEQLPYKGLCIIS